MENKKKLRWGAELNKIIRRSTTIAWMIFGFYEADLYHNANSVEEKIDAVFWILFGCFSLGIILVVFLENLLRPLSTTQRQEIQKDTAN